jgi:3-deoxy-7-phosphoheptulonate synthase
VAARAEYLLARGNANVVLCERGIKTFETATRNTLDLAAVALVKELSHLPVLADPSHGTGMRRFDNADVEGGGCCGCGLIVD